MKIRAIVFDLDGTLIDGYEAIHDALNHAVTQLGQRPFGLEETRQMVGHGLEHLLEDAIGPDLAPEGVRLFREYYPSVVLKKTVLLPGVENVLKRLAESGYAISLASNKPAEFTREILEANHIAHFFSDITGPDHAHPPKPNPAMLQTLLASMRVTPGQTVCVGDMEVDVEFARRGGCRVILIPSGSRNRDYLETLNADLIINDLSALPESLKRLPANPNAQG